MAEHLGLDTIWISERYGTKDLGVLGGAIPQATADIKIASGVAHFLFRHPLVLAGMALTLQALSGERFMLGVGRSVGPMWGAVGLPKMTNQALADCADIHRRLCRGEKVKYDGPAGRFPSLRLGDVPDVAPPPTLLAAIGPKTLELAGRHFDGAILHPFLTTDAVRASADKVRAGAEAAGRDPDAARIYATVVTAPDLTDEQELAVVGGRAVTYYQIPEFGELLARVNGWDPAGLATLRSHPMLANLRARPTTCSPRMIWPRSAGHCLRSGCTRARPSGRLGRAPTGCTSTSPPAPTRSSSTAPSPICSGRPCSTSERAERCQRLGSTIVWYSV